MSGQAPQQCQARNNGQTSRRQRMLSAKWRSPSWSGCLWSPGMTWRGEEKPAPFTKTAKSAAPANSSPHHEGFPARQFDRRAGMCRQYRLELLSTVSWQRWKRKSSADSAEWRRKNPLGGIKHEAIDSIGFDFGDGRYDLDAHNSNGDGVFSGQG